MDYRQGSGEIIRDSSWVMRDLWDTRVAQGRGFVTFPKKLSSLGVKRLMERAIWAQGLRKKLEPGKKRHPYQANHFGHETDQYREANEPLNRDLRCIL